MARLQMETTMAVPGDGRRSSDYNATDLSTKFGNV